MRSAYDIPYSLEEKVWPFELDKVPVAYRNFPPWNEPTGVLFPFAVDVRRRSCRHD